MFEPTAKRQWVDGAGTMTSFLVHVATLLPAALAAPQAHPAPTDLRDGDVAGLERSERL